MAMLLEVLTAGLDEWPDGIDVILQQHARDLRGAQPVTADADPSDLWGVGYAWVEIDLMERLPLADDWDTAVVTESQWRRAAATRGRPAIRKRYPSAIARMISAAVSDRPKGETLIHQSWPAPLASSRRLGLCPRQSGNVYDPDR